MTVTHCRGCGSVVRRVPGFCECGVFVDASAENAVENSPLPPRGYKIGKIHGIFWIIIGLLIAIGQFLPYVFRAGSVKLFVVAGSLAMVLLGWATYRKKRIALRSNMGVMVLLMLIQVAGFYNLALGAFVPQVDHLEMLGFLFLTIGLIVFYYLLFRYYQVRLAEID
jgi:hypothetical protein